MKAMLLASLFSLTGIAASAAVAVPQKPFTLGSTSRIWPSPSVVRGTHFGFVLPRQHEIAQCARAELRWENGTSPYRLSVAFGPKDGNLVQYYEVYSLRSHSYPLVVCGPSYGTLQANISDGEGLQRKLWYPIMPSSDSRCLD